MEEVLMRLHQHCARQRRRRLIRQLIVEGSAFVFLMAVLAAVWIGSPA